MILAAGRGQRMKPLSDHTPKPLLSCGGRPLIDQHLRALASAGFTEIVINLAWLGHQIRAYVGDGRAWGVTVRFSHETDGALETAGGIRHALPLLGTTEPFLVVNGDIVTDYPFDRRALHTDDLAHLVLVDRPAERERGDFDLREGRVVDAANPRLTYSGIGIFRPALFQGGYEGPEPLAPILKRAATGGRASGERYIGYWRDVGTPGRLTQAEMELARPAVDKPSERN
jgi:MurNAc alpha-1-phosphate uridylyltransferase